MVHADRAQRLGFAARLIDAHRYEDARRLLVDVLADHESNAEAISLLALVATNTGDHDTAVETAFRAMALAPDSATIKWRTGQVLLRAKRAGEAKCILEDAVRLSPSTAGVRVALARACHGSGDTQAAFGHLRAALELDPNHAEAWNLRAVLLAIVGLHAESKEAASEALRLAPSGTHAHLAAGFSALHLGQLRDARNALRESLRIDPGNSTSAELYTYAAMNSLPFYDRIMALPVGERRIAARIGAVITALALFFIALHVTGNEYTATIIAYLFGPIIGDVFVAFAVISISTDRLARNGLRRGQLPTAIWFIGNLVLSLGLIILGRLFGLGTLSAIAVISGYSAVATAYFTKSWRAAITFPFLRQFAKAGLIVTGVIEPLSILCALASVTSHPRHIAEVWGSLDSTAPSIERGASAMLAGCTTLEAAVFSLFYLTLIATSSIQQRRFGKARASARV